MAHGGHSEVTKMRNPSLTLGARDLLSHMTTTNSNTVSDLYQMFNDVLNQDIKLDIHIQTKAVENVVTWKIVTLLN